jgi:putative nucleotidyltransferase with HDIG domain
VLPADVPLVRPATVRQLAAAFARRPHGIIYPVFHDRRGHPPLIARSILDQAVDGAPGPLCELLKAQEENALDVPVDDEAIHLDMDTPADFDTLRKLAARYDIPATGECEAMLMHQQVPDAVVRHSRKVAEVAGKIADALSEAGLAIKPELVRAGALLHDLAKGQPDHAQAGAAILRDLGMPKVAHVVAAHTEMEFAGTIDERAIVYLADKLTGGDRLVTLDERFRRALDRFRDHADALQAARRRKVVAERIAVAVEARLGMPLFAVLSSGDASSVRGLTAPVSGGVNEI